MTSIPEPAVKPAFECERPEFDAPPAAAIVASLSSSLVAADEHSLSSLDPPPELELALSHRSGLESGGAQPAVATFASVRSSCVAVGEQPLSSLESYPELELALSHHAEPGAGALLTAVASSVAVDEQRLAFHSYAAPELALSQRAELEASLVALVPLAVGAFTSSVAAVEQPLSSSNSCATLVPLQQLEPEADAAPPPTVPADEHFFTPSSSYAALSLSPTSLKPRRKYILPSHAKSRQTGAIAEGVAVGLGFPDATPAFRKATAVKNAHPDGMDTDSDEEDDITDSAATLFDTPSSSEAPSTSESDVELAGDDATSQVRDTAAEPALDETAPTWALAHKRPALEFWGNTAVAVFFTVLAIVWTCFAAMPKLIEKVDDDGWTAFFQLEAGFVWSFVTLLWLQTYRRQHLWLVAFENMALASSFIVGIGGYAALALGTQYVFASLKAAREGGELAAVAAAASCNSSVSI